MQVDLLPLAISNRDHMAQYGLVDIGLDPWPYAGTTTTAEALVMGEAVGDPGPALACGNETLGLRILQHPFPSPLPPPQPFHPTQAFPA